MKYYANPGIFATVKVSGNSNLSRAWKEISFELYKVLKTGQGRASDWKKVGNEDAPVEALVAPTKVTIEKKEEPKDIVDEEPIVDEFDPLNFIGEEFYHEEDSNVVSINSSVAESEEAELSNIFDSIKDLRERADKSRSAEVTKGKSKGVYLFVDGNWVKE